MLNTTFDSYFSNSANFDTKADLNQTLDSKTKLDLNKTSFAGNNIKPKKPKLTSQQKEANRIAKKAKLVNNK